MHEVIAREGDGAVVEHVALARRLRDLDGVGRRVRRAAGQQARVGVVVLVRDGVVGERLVLDTGSGARVGRREGALDLDGLVGCGRVVEDVLRELLLRLRQEDAVLRTLRAGDRGDDRREVELHVLAVARLVRGVVPERLLLRVRLDERDGLLVAAGQTQVVERDVVDGEHRSGRAELRAHVADRGAVGERDGPDAGAVELDELADHAVLAQHVGDRQDDVGRGDARGDLAGELETDDARDEHRHGLTEHRGLGLDAADAPAQDAEAVDHRGVGVGADAGVGVCAEHAVDVAVVDDLREVLDVHLVDDAGARRDDLEVVECALTPTEELVTLAVALVLDLDVALEGVLAAEQVGDDRVVDDHLGGRERVDAVRVTAERGHRLAHGGEVDDAGHAREVLHHDAGGRELDLGVGLRRCVPRAQRTDLLLRHVRAVLGAQEVLEQHLEAEGKTVVTLDRGDPEDLVVGTADRQGALGSEAVNSGHVCSPSSAGRALARTVPSSPRRTGRSSEATLSRIGGNLS
ncbi:hypothetical protein QE367_000292 [Microbacterium paludicola]|uniref:Uncharacterized protein n=1 Tax=Microbacterium paludicola TaxID=300019 RepID=A0ABU1HZ13_9MICO|nr:hypothetical protein [Microbacterium paludicola]